MYANYSLTPKPHHAYRATLIHSRATEHIDPALAVPSQLLPRLLFSIPLLAATLIQAVHTPPRRPCLLSTPAVFQAAPTRPQPHC